MPVVTMHGSSIAATDGAEVTEPPLSEVAYERLRDAVIRGELRPNERLVETELAKRLEISRTPIRAGLQRLVDDGLVLRSRHGWVVKEHSADEVREIYEIRAALEGFGARLAADRASDQQLERIGSYYPRDLAPLLAGPREHLVGLNRVFHTVILSATGNQRLVVTWQRSREFNLNMQLARRYGDEEMAGALRGHHAIIDALKARDPAAAEEAARAHVGLALQKALEKL